MTFTSFLTTVLIKTAKTLRNKKINLYHVMESCLFVFYIYIMYSFISALFFKIGLFFGCDGSSLLHASFSLVSVSGGYSSQTPHCSGFSCETQAPGTWASVAAVRGIGSCSLQALECRLSSRGAWCSCSAAGGVFPDQQWNQCALRRKVDS